MEENYANIKNDALEADSWTRKVININKVHTPGWLGPLSVCLPRRS